MIGEARTETLVVEVKIEEHVSQTIERRMVGHR